MLTGSVIARRMIAGGEESGLETIDRSLVVSLQEKTGRERRSGWLVIDVPAQSPASSAAQFGKPALLANLRNPK